MTAVGIIGGIVGIFAGMILAAGLYYWVQCMTGSTESPAEAYQAQLKEEARSAKLANGQNSSQKGVALSSVGATNYV